MDVTTSTMRKWGDRVRKILAALCGITFIFISANLIYFKVRQPRNLLERVGLRFPVDRIVSEHLGGEDIDCVYVHAQLDSRDIKTYLNTLSKLPADRVLKPSAPHYKEFTLGHEDFFPAFSPAVRYGDFRSQGQGDKKYQGRYVYVPTKDHDYDLYLRCCRF